MAPTIAFLATISPATGATTSVRCSLQVDIGDLRIDQLHLRLRRLQRLFGHRHLCFEVVSAETSWSSCAWLMLPPWRRPGRDRRCGWPRRRWPGPAPLGLGLGDGGQRRGALRRRRQPAAAQRQADGPRGRRPSRTAGPSSARVKFPPRPAVARCSRDDRWLRAVRASGSASPTLTRLAGAGPQANSDRNACGSACRHGRPPRGSGQDPRGSCRLAAASGWWRPATSTMLS